MNLCILLDLLLHPAPAVVPHAFAIPLEEWSWR